MADLQATVASRWMVAALLCAALLVTPRAYAEDGQPSAEVQGVIAAAADLEGNEALATLEAALAKAGGADAVALHEALAARFVREGLPYASLAHFETLTTREPRNVAWLLSHARALIATARANLQKSSVTAARVVPYLEDARGLLDRVEPLLEKRAPERAQVTVLRVEALFFAGELEQARTVLESAAGAPFPAATQRALDEYAAQVHWRLGSMEASAQAFERAGNALGAAAAWTSAKNADKAIRGYAPLLEAAPANATLWTQALRAARFTGGESLLAEALASMKALTPDTQRQRVLGFLAEAAGDTDAARAHFTTWSKLAPEAAEPHLRLGNLALMAGTGNVSAARQGALEAWLEALRLEPRNARVHGVLWHLAGLDYKDIWLQAGGGDAYRRTRAVQRALVEAVPEDATAWSNLGNTLRLGGEVEASLEAYARAAEENPHDPAIHSDRGLALLGANRPLDALEAFEDALEVDEDHLSARQNAARVLWRQGTDAKAQAHLHKALRAARLVGRDRMTWRFLLDRVWRTQQAGAAR